jgi:hypothetical protein
VELHEWNFSTNINYVIESKRVMCAGPVTYMGKKSNVYGVLVTEAEGKRILGRAECR